jgi:outer membrane protein OmpA-like peptidoglycan-associated protein/opacity protein-like surface antigen
MVSHHRNKNENATCITNNDICRAGLPCIIHSLTKLFSLSTLGIGVAVICIISSSLFAQNPSTSAPVSLSPTPTSTSITKPIQQEPLEVPTSTPVIEVEKALQLGVIGGYALMENKTKLPVYFNSPSCGSFSDGHSQDLFFGLTVDFPFTEYFSVSGRILYSQRPASLSMRTSNGLEAFDPEQNSYVPFVRENVYTANLKYIGLDAGVRFSPLVFLGLPIPLYFRASADGGDPVFGTSFVQTEEIIQPRALLFPSGLKRQTLFEGEMDNTTTQFGATISAGYDFQPSKRLFVSPEIGYRKGLTSVVRNADWSIDMMYAAVNVRLTLADDPPPPPLPPLPPPKPTPPEPKPIAKKEPLPLVIQSYNTNPLEIQETVVTETYPLLPYIFFDSTSSVLRSRYQQKPNTADFDERALSKQTLAIYYELLNIIGKRLKNIPKATIVVTGTTDGRELPASPARKKLAEDRAKSVVDYLTTVWGIEQARIQLKTEDIPSLSSNPNYSEGLQENRRVEISSSMPEILAPVVHSRFMEYTPVNNKQVFAVQALRPERAGSYEARVLRSGRTLASKQGSGAPATIPFEIDTTVMISLGSDIAMRDSLDGYLAIQQNDGGTPVSATCRFPIIKSQNQFEVSRLSLIVFDFDRADINSTNRSMMERFVKEAVTPKSKVTITGSTDRLGEMQYNKVLSQQRADAGKNLLLELNPSANIETSLGIGASMLKYDNDLPEGRYYCRTVSIMVQTPLKK